MPSVLIDRLPPINLASVRVFSGPGFACQVLFADTIVEIDNGTTSATTVILPDLGGGPYTIVDGAQAAATHPIVIETSAALVIATISTNGGAASVAWDGVQWVQTGAGFVPQQAVFSVTSYGAKGIGTDDTAAIVAADVAAAAAGAALYFPPGTYGINNTSPTFLGNNWTGAGSNLSILKALAQTYPNNASLANFTSKNGFRITGMGFDYSAGTFPPGVGNPGNVMPMLDLTNCTNWSIDHCSFTGIQPHTGGIEIEGGSAWTITSCYFNMPSPTGTAWNQAINVSVDAGPVSDYKIIDNIMIGTGLFSEGSDGLIMGNYTANVQYGAGLACGPLASCVRNKFIGNTCLSGVGKDINLDVVNGIECWGFQCVIIGNICSNNAGSGIVFGGQNIVSNNICMQNGQFGGASGNGITGYSIVGFAASECIISGNICQDNQSVKTQAYGYAEFDNSGGGITLNTIEGNNFNLNALGTMLIAGSEVSFRGPQIVVNGGSYTPGGIPSGSSVAQTVTVAGAALGDLVKVSFSIALQAVTLTGYVTSAGQVVCLFNNVSGGTITLGAGNLYIAVEKAIGYASLG